MAVVEATGDSGGGDAGGSGGKAHLGVGVGRKEAATRLKKRRGMHGGIRRHVQTRRGTSATTVR